MTRLHSGNYNTNIITNIAIKSLLFLFIISLHFVGCWGITDSEVLLNFKASLENINVLPDWNDGVDVCEGDKANWFGVFCDEGLVLGIQLESMGLKGTIDVNSLAQLEELKSLSLMNNEFEGALPDFRNLLELRSLYLANNKFSGEIPTDSFKGMDKLKKLYLSGNEFTGEIPSSLAGLSKLTTLRLENNGFTGLLPNFTEKFESFNASNNGLEGPIPASLSNIDSTAFSGNKELCGKPLANCNGMNAPTPSPSSNSNSKSSHLQTANGTVIIPNDLDDTTDPASTMPSGSKKPSTASIVFVAIVGAVAVCGIIAAAFILMRRRQQATDTIESANALGIPDEDPSHRPTSKVTAGGGGGGGGGKKGGAGGEETMKLSFVREDRGKFELHDLLKASAELLGSGCFGSSYKAALTSGQVMVVKRFKQMNNVGREEFHDHMRRIGKLRHTNLLPLVAYYYRKEEKLLVHDFVPYGSLAVHLHGHQALGQPSLEWENRVKIIKGVARGLSYLYKEVPSIIAAHGHLKSNNVLLDENFEPYLTDYGLIPVINQESAQELMVAYKSPEYLRHGRITKKTDVWALGMLVLEVVTGKLSSTFLKQGGNKPCNSNNESCRGGVGGGDDEDDLVSWVRLIPEDRWPREVVDKELQEDQSLQGDQEMVKLIRIGLSCCEGDVEKRLDLKKAVERIEEMKINVMNDDNKESFVDDDFYSSYSEGGVGGISIRRPSAHLSTDFDNLSS
ncbi:Pollen receptor-like kinase 1 [Linum grandiflorum]